MAPLTAMSNKDWNDDDDLLELGPADQVGKNKRGDAHANGEDELLSLDGPGKKRRSPKHRRGCLGTILYFFGVLILLGGLCAAGGGYMLYQWVADDLPSFSKIADYRPPLVTTVLARDGSLIGQFYRERRFLVTLDQLPKFVPQAFLAVEDDQFYNHPGVAIKAIIRAAIANFQHGGTRQGGSTITQQVVKRLMLTPEKSYERKLKEAILAYRLEKKLSKDDILTLYINQIFLGNNAYGVEAAARVYFAKNARDLTIAEAALGCTVSVPTLRTPQDLRIPEGTQSGTVFKPKGCGIKKLRSQDNGDLYVTVVVEVPKTLTREQRDLMRKLDAAFELRQFPQKREYRDKL